MQQTAYARIACEKKSERKKGPGASITSRKTVIAACKDICRSLVAFLFNQIGVCALLILYNILGAFCFIELEGVRGDSTVEQIAIRAQDDLVRTLWNLTMKLNVLEEPLWKKQTEEAVNLYQATLVPLIRWKGFKGVMPIEAWTFPAALMYSLSIYTTIGYGNLVPRTDAGKVVTVCYAVLGMPLMLLYMSNVGEASASLFKFLYFRICNCKLMDSGDANMQIQRIPSSIVKECDVSQSIKRGSRGSTHSTKLQPVKIVQLTEAKTIPILWCLSLIGLYVLIGGILFSHWEGWTVFDGCYFCYISLSTIGFGDMVPGRVLDQDNSSSNLETLQVMVTVYLLVGMALLAMCFNLMQEEALESIKAFCRSLGCLRGRTGKKQGTKT